MDGECDIHHVTVSTTLLFAINSSGASKQYRYVSLSWPGMIGVLSSVNETEIYSTENAGPSQIGAQVKLLVTYLFSPQCHRNCESNVIFSSLHRYESTRQQMEAQLRLKKSNTYWSVEHIRSLLQSACKGHTKHTIEVELELNGKIILHIHLVASEFGMWYAPYEPTQTNKVLQTKILVSRSFCSMALPYLSYWLLIVSVYNFIGAAFLACKPESLEHLFVGSANVLINDGMARASPTTSYRSVDINCILFAPPCVVSIDSMVMQ
ncbi:unnamed protein product [Adineta ricciae]|uniref:Uncharacterized protein n=1 Tax=Adineta ricciae TaxID=249248 RepID=A0A815HVC7_ADIRI|nr:unnamed protein product [Adineta ricciae]